MARWRASFWGDRDNPIEPTSLGKTQKKQLVRAGWTYLNPDIELQAHSLVLKAQRLCRVNSDDVMGFGIIIRAGSDLQSIIMRHDQ